MKCPECNAENKNGAKFCLNCGASLVREVPQDGSVRRKKEPTYATGKNPTVATVISFVLVGGGQFYNGDLLKGIVMLGGALLRLVTGVGSIIFWVWSMLDAYNVAKGNWKKWS